MLFQQGQMHELEQTEDGKASMVYTGEVPWHGLGTVVPEGVTTKEALELSRANFNVEIGQLYTGDNVPVQARFTYRKVVHPDGREEKQILGHHVGMEWHPLQNADAFAWFDPFLTEGLCTIESAGVIRNGARVWVLAKIKQDPIEVVPGDVVDRYILLGNSHDGRAALSVGFTPIRVVCSNTLSAAINSDASKIIRIRHTGKVLLALDSVRATMDVINSEFKATAEQYAAMAACGVDDTTMEKYVRMVVAPDVAARIWDGDKEVTEGLRVWKNVQPLIHESPGANIPGVAGTLWAAYNGITRWLSHTRGKDAAIRVESTWFGEAQKTNKRAVDVALALIKKLKG